MQSFHDYHLTGYSVDGQAKEVRLRLEWLSPPDAENPRPPQILVFRGVQDYFLEHDMGINIVYGIEEVSLEEHVRSNADSFAESSKWGWPRFWLESADATTSQLRSKGMKCFELSSSYGLSGWVVAASAHASAA
jgi:hypothetical protein